MNQSACADILRLLVALPRGGLLSDMARNNLREHLDSCPECRDRFKTVVAMGTCLASSGDEDQKSEISDVEIEARVRAGVAAGMKPQKQPEPEFRPEEFKTIDRGRVFAGLGILAAAACIALVVFWPGGSSEEGYIVAATSTVVTDTMGSPDEFYRITVELRRPAFVRLAARDCNGVVALVTKGVSTASEEAVTGVWQGSLNAANLDDPNCRRSHALVIAGLNRLPDELEVLAQTPSDTTADRLAKALESAKYEIEERFGCEVRIVPLSPTP